MKPAIVGVENKKKSLVWKMPEVSNWAGASSCNPNGSRSFTASCKIS